MIVDWLKTRSHMKQHLLTDIEKNQLLKYPLTFQPDDIVNPNDFHFGHTHHTYNSQYSEEYKVEYCKNSIYHSHHRLENKPFLHMIGLMKCGNNDVYTSGGCGKVVIYCDNIRFGQFCVFEVISYINDDKIKFVDDVVLKKIFIDTYNCCLVRQTTFKGMKQP